MERVLQLNALIPSKTFIISCSAVTAEYNEAFSTQTVLYGMLILKIRTYDFAILIQIIQYKPLLAYLPETYAFGRNLPAYKSNDVSMYHVPPP